MVLPPTAESEAYALGPDNVVIADYASTNGTEEAQTGSTSEISFTLSDDRAPRGLASVDFTDFAGVECFFWFRRCDYHQHTFEQSTEELTEELTEHVLANHLRGLSDVQPTGLTCSICGSNTILGRSWREVFQHHISLHPNRNEGNLMGYLLREHSITGADIQTVRDRGDNYTTGSHGINRGAMAEIDLLYIGEGATGGSEGYSPDTEWNGMAEDHHGNGDVAGDADS